MPTVREYADMAQAAEGRGDYAAAAKLWMSARKQASGHDGEAYAAASLRCWKASKQYSPSR